MKKKYVKPLFLILMAIVIALLSYKIYTIEMRKAELADALVLAEKQEQSAKDIIERQRQEYEAWQNRNRQKQRVIVERDGDGNERKIQILEESPPPPPPPAMMQFSLTEGIRVELNNTTSWNTVLQLIFTLLTTYLGIALINKHVKE